MHAATNSSADVTELQYGSSRPNSLVLKKMEKAKKRWWRKVYREGVRENVLEVPQTPSNALQDTLEVNLLQPQASQSTDGQELLDTAVRLISNATHSFLDNTAVIVKTGDDGSILIQLPPPKKGLEQSASVEHPVTAFTEKKNDELQLPRATSTQDDDTIYIKLPFPQKQRTLLSDNKEEVDPPLRGVSIHDHPNLKRRPPSPLELHNHNTQHSHSHEGHHVSIHAHQEHHSGVLDALREEFGTWMEKHGKRYGSSEEKERRFHVWKRNHFR
jgi:hypothetical protein